MCPADVLHKHIVHSQHVDTVQALQDEGLGAGKSITEDELKHRKSSAVRAWMVSVALQPKRTILLSLRGFPD